MTNLTNQELNDRPLFEHETLRMTCAILNCLKTTTFPGSWLSRQGKAIAIPKLIKFYQRLDKEKHNI